MNKMDESEMLKNVNFDWSMVYVKSEYNIKIVSCPKMTLLLS